jgi:hypothetical protein
VGKVPWCDACDRLVPDDDLVDERACPTCGEDLGGRAGIPWHFKLMGVATAIYLLYRLAQGVEWIAHHA